MLLYCCYTRIFIFSWCYSHKLFELLNGSMRCYCKSNLVCLISQLFFLKYLFPSTIFLPIIRCLVFLFLFFKHFLKFFRIIIFYILSKVPKHQVMLESLCLLQRSKSPPKNFLYVLINFEHFHQEIAGHP